MEKIKPTLIGLLMLATSAALCWLFFQLFTMNLTRNMWINTPGMLISGLLAFYFAIRGLFATLMYGDKDWRRHSAEAASDMMEGLGSGCSNLIAVIFGLGLIIFVVVIAWNWLSTFMSGAAIIQSAISIVIIMILAGILSVLHDILKAIRSNGST